MPTDPLPPETSLDAVHAGLELTAPSAGAARSTVSLGMVTSVDGAAAAGGVSGPLGGDADHAAFRRLRTAADAIVVGAGTVRAERYRPPDGDDERRTARRDAGLAEVPALVVVSGRLDLPNDHPVLGAARGPVVVVTHGAAPADRRAALEEHVEVVTLGTGAVDLARLLAWTLERGWGRVLCEGGPRLAGALAAGGLLDEVFVTLAPQLASGEATRIVAGPALDPPRDLRLVSLQRHADELVLRYRVHAGPDGGTDGVGDAVASLGRDQEEPP